MTKSGKGDHHDVARSTADDTHPNHKGSKPWSRKKILRVGISVLLFALVFHFFILPLFANFDKTWQQLQHLNPWLTLVAVVLELSVWYIYGQTYRLLLPIEDRPSPLMCYGVTMASSAFSNVIPAGAAGTVAIDYKLMRQCGVPGPQLVYAFGAAGVVTALMLNIMLVLSLAIAIPTTGDSNNYGIGIGLSVLLFVVIGVVVWALLKHTKKTAEICGKALGWIPGVHAKSVESSVIQAADEIRELLKDKHRFWRLIALSVLKWSVGSVAAWVVFLALGHELNFFAVFVSFALAQVMSALPISPGGLGVFAATMISSLAVFGTDHSLATAGVLAFRAINYWMPIPIGTFAYFWVEREAKKGNGVAPRMKKALKDKATASA